MRINSSIALRFVALGAALQAGVAFTQPAGYPSKPIRLVVPLAPGGPSDILARTLAQKMSEGIKQTVFVDNRPGATGIVGTEITAKAPPDGYTMMLVSNLISVNPGLFPKLPYDTLRDLAPVSLLAATPYVLLVHPSLPVKTVKEMIALAKARPGQLNHASGGQGTGPHLAMEVFRIKTGINFVQITYKGGGPAMNDFIAGQTQIYLANLLAANPHIKSGRVRPLATSRATRAKALPEVPTIIESGVPDFDEGGQHGIVIPAGVPREVVTRLHAEIVKAMNADEVRKRLEAEGSEVVASTPEEYGAGIRRDIAKWTKVIKEAGIRPD